jgi:hypothetical protein
MQVRPDVGEFVDPNPRAARGGTKGLTHGSFVFTKRPRAVCPLTVQDDVHRPARAHGARELAMTALPVGAAVLGSGELEVNARREDRQLHSHDDT